MASQQKYIQVFSSFLVHQLFFILMMHEWIFQNLSSLKLMLKS